LLLLRFLVIKLRMDGWMDGWMDGVVEAWWMDGRVDELLCTDISIDELYCCV